jgi:hypothetical protein
MRLFIDGDGGGRDVVVIVENAAKSLSRGQLILSTRVHSEIIIASLA